MTGRFMSEEEQSKTKAEANTVVWYSNSIETSKDLAKKMKILSQWIRWVVKISIHANFWPEAVQNYFPTPTLN